MAIEAYNKLQKSIKIVNASLDKLEPYDAEKDYSPAESEPYDALSGRFVRAVEMSIKFFKTYELLLFGESSDTARDLLNRMEKNNIISSTRLWFYMRDVRNRIAHEYLPNEIKQIYDDIMYEFGTELRNLSNKKIDIENL